MQQPSICQPFGQHHEPCQPEAFLFQAEADQQAVSLEYDTAIHRMNGSLVNIKTNVSAGTVATLLAAPSSRAHSQPTARRLRTRPNKPIIRTNLRSWICGNMDAGNPQRKIASALDWVVHKYLPACLRGYAGQTGFSKHVQISLWVRWRLVTISGMARGSSLRTRTN